jgi:predicted nucleic acid-binding protein
VIVFDTGALLALERNDRNMWARLKRAAAAEVPILVPLAAQAQAWRGGPKQARLAQALRYVEPASFDVVSRESGELCGRAGTDDVVDASVALVAARPGVTHICTSDDDDIRHLLGVLQANLVVIRC